MNSTVCEAQSNLKRTQNAREKRVGTVRKPFGIALMLI
jgi:hypothetical protein